MTGKQAIHGNYHEDRRIVADKSGNIIENIGRDFIENDSEQRQSLADAAAEIQILLEQLEKTYPTDTTVNKMKIATEAIGQIENNPTLMRRILSALKTGGTRAIKQFLNHPAASFVLAVLEDWHNTNIQSSYNNEKQSILEEAIIFKKIAAEIQLFLNIEQKQRFLFAIGALAVRAISLQKAAEIMELETDFFLQLLDLIGIEFSYLSEEDVSIENNW